MAERIDAAKVIYKTVNWGISEIREQIMSRKLSELKSGDYFPLPSVPYVSQYAGVDRLKVDSFYGEINDLDAAKRFGTDDLQEFSKWAWRSCGIVGVQMVISAVQTEKYKTMGLLNECLKMDGYKSDGDEGWYHDKLAKLAVNHGVAAQAKKFLPSSEVAHLINMQNYVLMSVKSETGGHLVLVFGFQMRENGKLSGFWVHDPSDWDKDGENRFVSKKEFDRISTNRAIVFTPLP